MTAEATKLPEITPSVTEVQEATPTVTETEAAGNTVEVTGSCRVTATGTATVDIRSGSGTEFDSVGDLTTGESLDVVGQTQGADGFTWWQISDLTWVGSDIVTPEGSCDNVPAVAP